MACRCICLNDIYSPIVSFNLVLILLWASWDEKDNTARAVLLVRNNTLPLPSLMY